MTLSHERFRFSGQASAAKRRDRSWYPKHHKSDPGNMPRCDCFPKEATGKTDIKTPASPPLIFEDPEYQSQTPGQWETSTAVPVYSMEPNQTQRRERNVSINDIAPINAAG